MSDHLANFLIAARSLLTPWTVVTVFGILVTIAAYYAYLDKRDRERIEREHESRLAREAPCRGVNSNICVAEGCYGEACLRVNRYFTTDTDEARAEMYRRADVARAAREAAERRMRGVS